jgi:murein DD-endopeptidase MepM/ murein hydrolase activator NlpD
MPTSTDSTDTTNNVSLIGSPTAAHNNLGDSNISTDTQGFITTLKNIGKVQFITPASGNLIKIVQSGHYGIDISNIYKKTGDSIYAVFGGVVASVVNQNWDSSGTYIYGKFPNTKSKQNAGYGNQIVIKHTIKDQNGKTITFYSYYDHLLYNSGNKLKKGSVVTAGQVIGKMGSTGFSLASHLHFEIVYDGKYLLVQDIFNTHKGSSLKGGNPIIF